MTPDVPPPSASAPKASPDGPTPVDALMRSSETKAAILAPSNMVLPTDLAKAAVLPDDPKFKQKVQSAKRALGLLFGLAYGAYAMWSLFLLTVLPSAEDQLRALIPMGTMGALIGGGSLIALGGFLFLRTTRSDVSVKARQWGLIKIVLIVLPGLALSAIVPLSITKEPTLYLQIVDPINADDFVAPVSVTISAETATTTLKKLNLKAVKYQWDTNNDGKIDEETVNPKTTIIFDRAMVQTAAVTILLEGGQKRKILVRVTVPRAVFDTSPARPIVDRPVKFSIAKLLADPKLLTDVTWDFGDASDPLVAKTPDVVHTYFANGKVSVSATVKLSNNTQQVFKRDITVEDPPPLPFPVTLQTEPKSLIAPAPIGVTFSIQTDEKLKDISWDFDSGKEEHGADLRRISHLFEQSGTYFVTVRLRSESGKLAELSTVVRATETLNLPDLRFEGSSEVQNGNIVKGEAPLTVQLTPKTSTPLVQFSWEDDEGTAVIAPNSSTFEKIYRNEGKYRITLTAQSADGKAMILPITIQVDPPSADPKIALKPEGGSAPLSVVLDASSTFIPPGQQIAGFEWTFGDETSGQRPVLGAARVEHIYKEAGEYSIQLRVVMIDGKDYKTTRKIVVRRPTLSSCFTASRTTVQVGKGVDFDSSCSVGTPKTYLWDIRGQDNPDLPLGQSADAGYSFVFDTPGQYQVNLTLTDAFENRDTKTIVITVTP